ncbi:MAG: hypothetical protein E7Z65_03650 [Thermoplasmata archaeon]|nr:hypothetical protein [Thermoplasmata archaeon]
MIPCRNLDAPAEQDILMTDENRAFIRNSIEKELGAFFYAVMWRDSVEQPIVDYLSECLAYERGLSIPECTEPVRRMIDEILKEVEADAHKCVDAYRESFPWDIVEKCLRDEKFSDSDMAGPRNKISQWLPRNIDDPFLSTEMPIVIMSTMDHLKAYESKMHSDMEKAPYRIDREKLTAYLLIEFKRDAGKFRFSHYKAMSEMVPDLLDRLVPMLKEFGITTVSLG